MKKIILSTTVICIIMSFTFLSVDLTIGSPIPLPDFKMKNINDNQVSFNDVKMKNGLLVVFSCNTCPWVIKNQQVASNAYNYALSKEIGVIVLNSNESQRNGDDSKAEMKIYSKQQKYNWPYVLDENSKMADEFGARVTPECYLFDKNMKLVYHGAITNNPKSPSESTREHLKVAVDELVDGKNVSMTTSRAMGCTIKRNS